jgi:uncharacterized protein
MKKILITGASGFVGKELSRVFLSKGYQVTGLGTSLSHPLSSAFQEFEWVTADTTVPGRWQQSVAGADIIINLAGRNIFHYWTKNYKQSIYDSRILTTKNLVNAMDKGSHQTLLTTSAVGIYGDCKDDVLTEKTLPGKEFLSRVCVDWEKQGLKAKDKGARVAVMRFGVVLGNGGALSKMTPAFKFFMGGPLGHGRQWFACIHIKDLERVIEFIIENPELEGVFNFTGPVPVQQKQFAKELGHALKRPAFMPAPAVMIRTIMGELGSSLLQSQRAVPQKLMDSGFVFLFPDVSAALGDIFGK